MFHVKHSAITLTLIVKISRFCKKAQPQKGNIAMIYFDSPASLVSDQFQGFFVGWPNRPSPAKHLEILQKSAYCVIAFDESSEKVVGFVTAISDFVSCAYIPHLEVLPDYQGQGIGTELMQRMLKKLADYYMIDLICDPGLHGYYSRFGMRPYSGALIRNFERQSCE
jgi:GNAT superfamily N-acetyltransferase